MYNSQCVNSTELSIAIKIAVPYWVDIIDFTTLPTLGTWHLKAEQYFKFWSFAAGRQRFDLILEPQKYFVAQKGNTACFKN